MENVIPAVYGNIAAFDRMYGRQKKFDDRFGLASTAEVRIAAERGFGNYRNLQEYVTALREREGAGGPTA